METYNVYHSVEVLEAAGLEHPRIHVILEMSVVEGDADAIEAERLEELGIGIHKEVFEMSGQPASSIRRDYDLRSGDNSHSRNLSKK